MLKFKIKCYILNAKVFSENLIIFSLIQLLKILALILSPYSFHLSSQTPCLYQFWYRHSHSQSSFIHFLGLQPYLRLTLHPHHHLNHSFSDHHDLMKLPLPSLKVGTCSSFFRQYFLIQVSQSYQRWSNRRHNRIHNLPFT